MSAPLGEALGEAPRAILRTALEKRVQTRTMTIYTEAEINLKMFRNGFRMHTPKVINT